MVVCMGLGGGLPLAVKMFRSLLEPPKPRDLLREELQGNLGAYAASILMDQNQLGG
jgi:hypothetical protein